MTMVELVGNVIVSYSNSKKMVEFKDPGGNEQDK